MPTLLEVLKGIEEPRSQAGRGALAVLTPVAVLRRSSVVHHPCS